MVVPGMFKLMPMLLIKLLVRLYARITVLPNSLSIKIPPVLPSTTVVPAWVNTRPQLPIAVDTVTPVEVAPMQNAIYFMELMIPLSWMPTSQPPILWMHATNPPMPRTSSQKQLLSRLHMIL